MIKIYQNISRSYIKREDILVVRIALNVAERFDKLVTTTFNQTMDPKKRKGMLLLEKKGLNVCYPFFIGLV